MEPGDEQSLVGVRPCLDDDAAAHIDDRQQPMQQVVEHATWRGFATTADVTARVVHVAGQERVD